MTHNSEQITLEKTVVKDLEVYEDKDLNSNYHTQQGIPEANKVLIHIISETLHRIWKCNLEPNTTVMSTKLKNIQVRATKLIPEMQEQDIWRKNGKLKVSESYL